MRVRPDIVRAVRHARRDFCACWLAWARTVHIMRTARKWSLL